MRRIMLAAILVATSVAPAFAQTRPVSCTSSVSGPAGDVSAFTEVSPGSKEIVSLTAVMWQPLSSDIVEHDAYFVPNLRLFYDLAPDGSLSGPTRARVVSGQKENAPGPRMDQIQIRYTTEGQPAIVTPFRRRQTQEAEIAAFIRTAKPASLTVAYIGPDAEVLASATFDLAPTAARDAQAREAITMNKPLVEAFRARAPAIDPYLCDRSGK